MIQVYDKAIKYFPYNSSKYFPFLYFLPSESKQFHFLFFLCKRTNMWNGMDTTLFMALSTNYLKL